MIGLNGHMFLQGVETPLTDYDAVTERVSQVPGVTLALPLVEGQAFASSPYGSSGALVRGIRGSDLARLPGVGGHIIQGGSTAFDSGQGVAVGSKLAEHLVSGPATRSRSLRRMARRRRSASRRG